MHTGGGARFIRHRRRPRAMCFHSQSSFHPLAKRAFADLCPSNPTDVWHESRRRGPGNDCLGGKKRKKRHNIFQNDPTRGPTFRALISIEYDISRVTVTLPAGPRRPTAGEEEEEVRANERGAKASSLSVILKPNWLHSNGRGDKSRRHFGRGAAFYR